MVDICSDVCGFNSLAPFYYDAICDSLKQTLYLPGKRIICNPPYFRAKAFYELLEALYSDDRSTRALFICPRKKKEPW